MFMRLLPLVGGMLLSRGGRRIAGRNAGKLALAVGAYEFWRNYQRSKASPSANPANGTYNAYPPRGRNRNRF